MISVRDCTDEQLDTFRQRLLTLASQLERFGPDHFSQGSWFYVPDLEQDLHLDSHGVDVDQLNELVNFTHCGTAGCLAGHGATVIARDQHDGHITAVDVAKYFNIPSVWFEGDLYDVTDHPFNATFRTLTGSGEIDHDNASWIVQLAAVKQRASEHSREIARRVFTGNVQSGA